MVPARRGAPRSGRADVVPGIVIIAILTGVVPAALAQEPSSGSSDEFQTWYGYFGDHPLRDGSRWELHFDAQYRAERAGPAARQTVVRPGLNYNVGPALQVSAGYAYTRSQLDDRATSPSSFPEHRVWEQLTVLQQVGPTELAHRVRVEQRYIGGAAIDGEVDGEGAEETYRNRARYRLTATFPLPEPSRSYLAASNELLIHVGSRADDDVFNQNRTSVAWGLPLGPESAVEVGYRLLLVRPRGATTTGRRHVLHVGVRSAAPLGF